VATASLAAPAERLSGPLARRGVASGLAFGAYALVSFLYWGRPLLFHGGSTYFGIRNGDAELEIWAFAWWPHALLHGLNPFVTHAVWAPTGASLAWPTMAPGLAVAFAPLTLLVGPLASFDVAQTLMPALAAWTAFLLCRHVTKSFWPSLAGGYFFGFSAYEIGQLQGHIHLTAVFLIPLVVLVLLSYVEGALSRRRLALLLGLLIGAELLISTEIAFTLTLMLVTVVVVAFVFAPELRRRLRTLFAPLLWAYAIAAIVASPLLYYMLTDFQSGRYNPISPAEYSTDLLNFVVPTDLEAASVGWAHAIYSHFHGWETEQGGYIGVPALVILVWFAATRWRSHAVRVLLVSIAAIAFLSFGTWLHVDGKQVITLPWEHIGYWPLFKNVLTGRFSMYVALGVGLAIAMWAAAPRPRCRTCTAGRGASRPTCPRSSRTGSTRPASAPGTTCSSSRSTSGATRCSGRPRRGSASGWRQATSRPCRRPPSNSRPGSPRSRSTLSSRATRIPRRSGSTCSRST
jgi:hypothetical protein